ncbi:MAG: hypothetical protein NT060_00085, partial [Candidatus Omnitrophica bacterium]|nr:hypothetical protein [Candidatus Omnitrophota bacterium]
KDQVSIIKAKTNSADLANPQKQFTTHKAQVNLISTGKILAGIALLALGIALIAKAILAVRLIFATRRQRVANAQQQGQPQVQLNPVQPANANVVQQAQENTSRTNYLVNDTIIWIVRITFLGAIAYVLFGMPFVNGGFPIYVPVHFIAKLFGYVLPETFVVKLLVSVAVVEVALRIASFLMYRVFNKGFVVRPSEQAANRQLNNPVITGVMNSSLNTDQKPVNSLFFWLQERVVRDGWTDGDVRTFLSDLQNIIDSLYVTARIALVINPAVTYAQVKQLLIAGPPLNVTRENLGNRGVPDFANLNPEAEAALQWLFKNGLWFGKRGNLVSFFPHEAVHPYFQLALEGTVTNVADANTRRININSFIIFLKAVTEGKPQGGRINFTYWLPQLIPLSLSVYLLATAYYMINGFTGGLGLFVGLYALRVALFLLCPKISQRTNSFWNGFTLDAMPLIAGAGLAIAVIKGILSMPIAVGIGVGIYLTIHLVQRFIFKGADSAPFGKILHQMGIIPLYLGFAGYLVVTTLPWFIAQVSALGLGSIPAVLLAGIYLILITTMTWLPCFHLPEGATALYRGPNAIYRIFIGTTLVAAVTHILQYFGLVTSGAAAYLLGINIFVHAIFLMGAIEKRSDWFQKAAHFILFGLVTYFGLVDQHVLLYVGKILGGWVSAITTHALIFGLAFGIVAGLVSALAELIGYSFIAPEIKARYAKPLWKHLVNAVIFGVLAAYLYSVAPQVALAAMSYYTVAEIGSLALFISQILLNNALLIRPQAVEGERRCRLLYFLCSVVEPDFYTFEELICPVLPSSILQGLMNIQDAQQREEGARHFIDIITRHNVYTNTNNTNYNNVPQPIRTALNLNHSIDSKSKSIIKHVDRLPAELLEAIRVAVVRTDAVLLNILNNTFPIHWLLSQQSILNHLFTKSISRNSFETEMGGLYGGSKGHLHLEDYPVIQQALGFRKNSPITRQGVQPNPVAGYRICEWANQHIQTVWGACRTMVEVHREFERLGRADEIYTLHIDNSNRQIPNRPGTVSLGELMVINLQGIQARAQAIPGITQADLNYIAERLHYYSEWGGYVDSVQAARKAGYRITTVRANPLVICRAGVTTPGGPNCNKGKIGAVTRGGRQFIPDDPEHPVISFFLDADTVVEDIESVPACLDEFNKNDKLLFLNTRNRITTLSYSPFTFLGGTAQDVWWNDVVPMEDEVVQQSGFYGHNKYFRLDKCYASGAFETDQPSEDTAMSNDMNDAFPEMLGRVAFYAETTEGFENSVGQFPTPLDKWTAGAAKLAGSRGFSGSDFVLPDSIRGANINYGQKIKVPGLVNNFDIPWYKKVRRNNQLMFYLSNGFLAIVCTLLLPFIQMFNCNPFGSMPFMPLMLVMYWVLSQSISSYLVANKIKQHGFFLGILWFIFRWLPMAIPFFAGIQIPILFHGNKKGIEGAAIWVTSLKGMGLNPVPFRDFLKSPELGPIFRPTIISGAIYLVVINLSAIFCGLDIISFSSYIFACSMALSMILAPWLYNALHGHSDSRFLIKVVTFIIGGGLGLFLPLSVAMLISGTTTSVVTLSFAVSIIFLSAVILAGYCILFSSLHTKVQRFLESAMRPFVYLCG